MKIQSEVRGTDVFKFIVVLISLVISLMSLFGNNPNLVIAYRTLFFLSVPVAPDYWDFIRLTEFEYKGLKIANVICFILSAMISSWSFLLGFVFHTGNDMPRWFVNHLKCNIDMHVYFIIFAVSILLLLNKYVFFNWKTKIKKEVESKVIYVDRLKDYKIW